MISININAEGKGQYEKNPFAHQREAIKKLCDKYKHEEASQKSGLLLAKKFLLELFVLSLSYTNFFSFRLIGLQSVYGAGLYQVFNIFKV